MAISLDRIRHVARKMRAVGFFASVGGVLGAAAAAFGHLIAGRFSGEWLGYDILVFGGLGAASGCGFAALLLLTRHRLRAAGTPSPLRLVVLGSVGAMLGMSVLWLVLEADPRVPLLLELLKWGAPTGGGLGGLLAYSVRYERLIDSPQEPSLLLELDTDAGTGTTPVKARTDLGSGLSQ